MTDDLRKRALDKAWIIENNIPDIGHVNLPEYLIDFAKAERKRVWLEAADWIGFYTTSPNTDISRVANSAYAAFKKRAEEE